MADMEGGGGPSIMDRMNQGQMGGAPAGGGGGGEGMDGPGSMIDALLRKLGFNAHSTNGLDSVINIQGIWSNLKMEASGFFSAFEVRGGILASILSLFTRDIQSHVDDIQGNPVDTSGSAGGGDSQQVSAATIALPNFDNLAGITASHADQITAPPARSEGTGSFMAM